MRRVLCSRFCSILIDSPCLSVDTDLMGRPKRQPDRSFAQRVEKLIAIHGSRRQVALAAGIAPTTLARSLDQKAFDRGTRDKVEVLLPREVARSRSVLLAPTGRARSVEEVLQILQKLSKLLPEAMQELEAAMSQADSPATTGAPGAS